MISPEENNLKNNFLYNFHKVHYSSSSNWPGLKLLAIILFSYLDSKELRALGKVFGLR